VAKHHLGEGTDYGEYTTDVAAQHSAQKSVNKNIIVVIEASEIEGKV
jgi:hypothetical protein